MITTVPHSRIYGRQAPCSYIGGAILFNLIKANVHESLGNTSYGSKVRTMMFRWRLELSESRGLHLLQPHFPETSPDLQSSFSSRRQEPSICLAKPFAFEGF